MINAESHPDFEILPNGRLADINSWTPEIADFMASKEGLELTEKHWNIINLMRDFYQQYNISPVSRLLKKNIRRQLGKKYANDEYLDFLFPNNVLIQGTRLAGLPIPQLDAEIERPEDSFDQLQIVESSPIQQANVSHFTSDFSFNGQNIKVHASGNLYDPSGWSEDMATVLAEKEGISLTEEHWEVVRYLRGYYFKYGITPMVRLLIDSIHEVRGDKSTSKEHLYELFPEGPARQGGRIAGLPEPQGCID